MISSTVWENAKHKTIDGFLLSLRFVIFKQKKNVFCQIGEMETHLLVKNKKKQKTIDQILRFLQICSFCI